jgi:hypothetical protein
MRPSLSDSTPKSIEQAENELFIYSHPQADETPAEASTIEIVFTDTPSENAPTAETSSFSEVLRQRFAAQREQIARQLNIISDVRQTIAQLRKFLEKPSPPE